MFGFGKKTELQKMEKQYKKLLDESYALSHSNRSASDIKAAEANSLMDKILELKAKEA